MMCYTVIATFCLLGIATAQTSLEITSCLTKEQHLQMSCKITPAQDLKISVCYFMLEGKLVASSNASADPDRSFKGRTNLSFEQRMCLLDLNGFSDDKPKNFTCNIKQSASQNAATSTATVEKSKLSTCSAWCTLQHSAVVFLLVFITSPLILELL